jgi:hypothetical protein
MRKEDVELVLIKSFDYWKSVLCNEVDLGELAELSNYIWESIKDDQEIDEKTKRIYVITKNTLSRLITKGQQTFRDIYGNKVVLKFVDNDDIPCLLESGALLLWNDKSMEAQKKIVEFPNDPEHDEVVELAEMEKEMEKLYKETTKKKNCGKTVIVSRRRDRMKVKIEFDLDEIYADEFRPIFDQPILKVMRDIKRAQSLIIDKISKDMETSYCFKNLSYEELYNKIDAWATRYHEEEIKQNEMMRKRY